MRHITFASVLLLKPPRPTWIWLAAVVYCAVTTHSLDAAHPIHASVAEVEWNKASQRFEIALRVDSFEFEQQLSFLTGRTVNLETTPEIQSLVRNYVARHFALRTQVSGTSRIHWHGEELEFRDYWIYFEVECESPPTEHPASESPSTNRKSASELQAQLRPQETQLAPLLERVPSAESEAPEAVNGSARPILRPQTPREMPAPDAAPNAASANTNRWTGLHIRNSLLTENRPQQVNYVTLRMNEQILSLHLTSEKPECDVGSLVAAGQHTRGKQAEEFRHPTVPSDNR